MSHRSTPKREAALVSWLVLSFAAWPGCEGSGPEGEKAPPVSVEQEQAMCDSLTSSGSTVSLPIQAGGTTAESDAMTASGAKTIELGDFQGALGGYIELKPLDGIPLIMLVREDVPVEVVDAAGEAVFYTDKTDGSEVCDEARGRLLWVVENAPNYLEIGPSSQAEVTVSLEVVEESTN